MKSNLHSPTTIADEIIASLSHELSAQYTQSSEWQVGHNSLAIKENLSKMLRCVVGYSDECIRESRGTNEDVHDLHKINKIIKNHLIQKDRDQTFR